MKTKKIAITTSLLLALLSGVFAQESKSITTTLSNSFTYSSFKAAYVGFGSIRSGTLNTRSTFNIGYLNELNFGKSTSLLFSGNLINSSYEYSTSSTGLVPPKTAYSLQLSLTAEPRVYLNDKYQLEKSTTEAFHIGWFATLPFEVNSSILTSSNPFAVSLFLGAAVGYRYAFSERFFLEAIGGVGETYIDFKNLRTTPYLRLKACYSL